MCTSGKRIALICKYCGSNDVTRDALARWSVEAQARELRGVLDDVTCEACGRETRLLEAELETLGSARPK